MTAPAVAREGLRAENRRHGERAILSWYDSFLEVSSTIKTSLLRKHNNTSVWASSRYSLPPPLSSNEQEEQLFGSLTANSSPKSRQYSLQHARNGQVFQNTKVWGFFWQFIREMEPVHAGLWGTPPGVLWPTWKPRTFKKPAVWRHFVAFEKHLACLTVVLIGFYRDLWIVCVFVYSSGSTPSLRT